MTGPRSPREAMATVWLMLVGAGLLATSPPEDWADPMFPVWSATGPAVTLSDRMPTRAFEVTVFVPKPEAGVWDPPRLVQLSLSVSAEHGAPNGDGDGDGSPGEAGAPSLPNSEGTPWLTATLSDSLGGPLVEPTPFLSAWDATTELALLGDCAAPDPDGADPCRLSFGIEFERSLSGNEAETTLRWSLNVAVSGESPDAGWTGEIEPL